MTSPLDLLSALFAADAFEPIPVQIDGEGGTVSNPEEIEKAEGHLGVLPLTGKGLAFIWRLVEDAEPEDWEACHVPATTVLCQREKRLMIFCWALEQLTPPERAAEIASVFDMTFEDAIPVPPTGDWEVLHCDANIFTTVEVLESTYCGEQEIEPGAEPEPEESPTPVETHNDAIVINGPYKPDQYAQPLTLTFGGNAETKHWDPRPMNVARLVDAFTKHQVGKKDGIAAVLGDMVKGRRLKAAVKSLHAVGIDIDTGTPGEQIDAALEKLGVLAIRVTTHSHYKTKTEIKKDRIVKVAGTPKLSDEIVRKFLLEEEHWDPELVKTAEYDGDDQTERGIVAVIHHAPMPKHRIIVPLKKPYVIADQGATQEEAMKKWGKVPTALAELLNVPLDKACLDPSRLFYLPRHDKDRPFEAKLFVGPLFDFDDLELDSFEDQLASDLGTNKSKSVTPEGRALGRWWMARGFSVQIADIIEHHAHDKIRGNATQGFDIECPFDENHSNAGDPDDRACFVVNAGDGQSEFATVSCRHESCRDKTTLDMIGKMVKDGWFEKEVLEDEDYIAEMDPSAAPNPEVAEKIIASDEASKKIEAEIAALPDPASEADITRVVQMILGAENGNLERDRLLELTCDKLKLKKKGAWNKLVSRELKKFSADKLKEEGREDKYKRKVFRYNGSYDFLDLVNYCYIALEAENKRRHEPLFCCLNYAPYRLIEKKDPQNKRLVDFEPISMQALKAEMNLLVTLKKQTEDGEGQGEEIPKEIGIQVWEQAYRHLRQVPEVLYTPVFLADGSLLKTERYHYNEELNLNAMLILNGLDLSKTYKADPDASDVEEAVEYIKRELLVDFPFCDQDEKGEERFDISLTHVFAMVITPFVRRMIDGRTPVFFIMKPEAGTGGTLLGQLPMLIFDGAPGNVTPYTQNEEEMQKTLLAAAMQRRSHLFFDNVREFNNEKLKAPITAPTITGRLLGQTTEISVPNTFNWIGTGNNTYFMDEMRRRTVFIQMNAKTPNVIDRTFRHPGVSGLSYTDFVLQNRSAIIGHILTIIQYWINLGQPHRTDRKRASFENWSEIVGGILQAAGLTGFLESVQKDASALDEATNLQFIKAFLEKYGTLELHRPNEIFEWAVDIDLDIISGNNENQQKQKFTRHTLPSINGRTYDIEGKFYMFRARSDKDGIGYELIYTLSREELSNAPRVEKKE